MNSSFHPFRTLGQAAGIIKHRCAQWCWLQVLVLFMRGTQWFSSIVCSLQEKCATHMITVLLERNRHGIPYTITEVGLTELRAQLARPYHSLVLLYAFLLETVAAACRVGYQ